MRFIWLPRLPGITVGASGRVSIVLKTRALERSSLLQPSASNACSFASDNSAKSCAHLIALQQPAIFRALCSRSRAQRSSKLPQAANANQQRVCRGSKNGRPQAAAAAPRPRAGLRLLLRAVRDEARPVARRQARRRPAKTPRHHEQLRRAGLRDKKGRLARRGEAQVPADRHQGRRGHQPLHGGEQRVAGLRGELRR